MSQRHAVLKYLLTAPTQKCWHLKMQPTEVGQTTGLVADTIVSDHVDFETFSFPCNTRMHEDFLPCLCNESPRKPLLVTSSRLWKRFSRALGPISLIARSLLRTTHTGEPLECRQRHGV
jgi:hypothetical protein